MRIEEVHADRFIHKFASYLEEHSKVASPPEAEHVKTSHARERAPAEKNWYFVRVASILRRLYMEELKNPRSKAKGCGVLWFAKAYRTAKNNGHKPSHTVTGSKSLVRRALQALESIQYVAKTEAGGRRLTNTGLAEMEAIARQCAASPQPAPQ